MIQILLEYPVILAKYEVKSLSRDAGHQLAKGIEMSPRQDKIYFESPRNITQT